ncbi:hypothetical protein N7471_001153 [Penicillium samsonianum]|uniref:uncharacterized protein n=1 Tax=Penicillium samsonianum TaxID=1882272 RepID=UPI002549ABF1|nr:uncharacterized protein N7471_001153 [Penicillium samsonianum]KAJ6149954.1 hypothetical protein N7471_001153 [Penicillium samsonianum]
MEFLARGWGECLRYHKWLYSPTPRTPPTPPIFQSFPSTRPRFVHRLDSLFVRLSPGFGHL